MKGMVDMATQRYQITESKRLTPNKNLCTIFIEDEAALSEIPEAISNDFAVGSVAYTKSFDIYFYTSNGWELS